MLQYLFHYRSKFGFLELGERHGPGDVQSVTTDEAAVRYGSYFLLLYVLSYSFFFFILFFILYNECNKILI